MKTVICFIAIVFFINIGFAQKNLQYDKWILKFSPLSLINPDGPNFHVATEYRFAFRWSAQVDIGLPVKILTFGEKGSKHDANYLNVRSELHYYFANRNNEKIYLGMEGFYIPQAYTRYNGHAQMKNGLMYSYSSSRIHKNISGSCIKMGIQPHLSNKLIMDLYYGAGLRWVTITHQLKDIVQVNDFPHHTFGNDIFEGIQLKPHFSLGFKIGYVL